MIQRLTDALSDRYVIQRELGAGGMATVYLAHDVRHHRKVALKVLRQELAAVLGGERFITEIRTTANLQHPHILPLFDSGEADGLLFYVMPYVEGESLRERLDREKLLPVDEAVGITVKVAGALQAAHERGVVHRDVKPANILLDRQGEPLVADFGIALALQQAGGGRLTETGLSLGTPYYMSPEQATADRDPDARSDVYSLGCVAYEMLTGDPPHAGATAQAIIARILTEEPRRVGDARASVPTHVRHAVRKAMEKLPPDRFGAAEAFARALQDPSFRHGTDPGATRPAAASGTRRPGRSALFGTALLAGGVVAGLLLGGRWSDHRDLHDVGLPFEAPIRGDAGRPLPGFAVSPDGTFIVYEALDGIWYRSLVSDEVRPVLGAEGGQDTPMISPDGSRIAFASPTAEGVAVVPVDGGRPSLVSDIPQAWAGVWTDRNQLFYGTDDGALLWWIDPENGPVRRLEVGYCVMPSLLSETEILCGGGDEKYASLGTIDGESFTQRPVVQRRAGGDVRLRGAHFRPIDEYLVYTAIDGTITATRWIDRDSLLVGRSVALVPGVRRAIYTGAGYYDLSDDGTLVYAPGANMEVAEMAVRELDGVPETLPIAPAAHLRFNPSPDGLRLASVVEAVSGQELRIYDLRTGRHEVVATGRYLSTPFWSEDGRELVFERVEGRSATLHRYRRDATGELEELFDGLRESHALVWWEEPSLFLFADQQGSRIDALDVAAERPELEPVLEGDVFFASISPDGRWLAWVLGSGTLYVESWPDRERRYSVGTGPIEPYWLSDGTLVIHLPEGEVYTATPTPGGETPFGPLELRIQDPRKGESPGWSNSITGNDRLLHPVSPEQTYLSYVRVVPGWVDEMKRAVDEANR